MEFSEGLKKKVKQAIKLLQSIKTDEPIEVAYSGGKDSDDGRNVLPERLGQMKTTWTDICPSQSSVVFLQKSEKSDL